MLYSLSSFLSDFRYIAACSLSLRPGYLSESSYVAVYHSSFYNPFIQSTYLLLGSALTCLLWNFENVLSTHSVTVRGRMGYFYAFNI